MIRRTAALVMAAVLAIAGLGGCAGSKKARSDKMQIVCTIFPAYDWTKTLLGSHEDEAEITYLQSDGSDLHSYEPSAKDLALISECDLFIFVGGESDSWSADAVKNAKNKKMKKIDLLEVLGSSVKDNSLADELDSKESEEEGSGSAAEGKAKEEPVHDEHVWLSPRNAEVFCNKITNALCELDQLHEEDYKKNLVSYRKKLNELDIRFSELAADSRISTLIFCDRFPFRYFAEDYGFKYYSAYSGCTSGEEASAEMLTLMSQKIDKLKINRVFTTEQPQSGIADTVISAAETKDIKTVKLDSMHSVDQKMIDEDTTYLSIMESNYDILEEALS